MNRKEKIQLLNEVAKGNKEALNKLKPLKIVILRKDLSTGLDSYSGLEDGIEYTEAEFQEVKQNYNISAIIKILSLGAGQP